MRKIPSSIIAYTVHRRHGASVHRRPSELDIYNKGLSAFLKGAIALPYITSSGSKSSSLFTNSHHSTLIFADAKFNKMLLIDTDSHRVAPFQSLD